MLNMWIPKGFSTNTMSPLRFRAVLNMWIPKDQNILAVCKNKKTSKRIAIAKSAMWQKKRYIVKIRENRKWNTFYRLQIK